jgi:hypothetical protein
MIFSTCRSAVQRLLSVANSRLLEVHRRAGQQAVVNCSFAALAVFHQAQFFKIENTDWLVIFRLQTGHSQPLDSQQRTFADECEFCDLAAIVFS